MKVLLVEPNYKNKYPPIGLMKISTYHKMLGDEVHFVKGTSKDIDSQVWDRIYITTLFTFYFDITIKTINHYLKIANDIRSLYVGGIMASLMPERIIDATGMDMEHILVGLFTDTSKVGDNNSVNIDQLPLDYDILDEITYKYPAGDNYFSHTSRGCPNHCPFCAIPILEPHFYVTNNIKKQIETINNKYGPKQNLLLLDNNVLNTPNLKELVDDLCSLGFERGAKFVDPGTYNIIMSRYHKGDRSPLLDNKLNTYLDSFKARIKSSEMLEKFIKVLIKGETISDFAAYMLDQEHVISPIIEKYRNKNPKARYLDFNQGVDARKINDENMFQLSRLSIRPLRIAFDSINLSKQYINAVKTAHKYGIREISNYILFNYNDTPASLYERLLINIELNKELGIQIFSFPMKYSPINRIDRNYIGKFWTRKALSAISAILQVSNGVVAAGSNFFLKAFGNTLSEYFEILAMPRSLIMFRQYFEENGTTNSWREEYNRLDNVQRNRLMHFVSKPVSELKKMKYPKEFESIIPYYLISYNGNGA